MESSSAVVNMAKTKELSEDLHMSIVNAHKDGKGCKAELPTSTDFPYFIRKSNKNTEVRIGVEKYAFWKIP